MANQEISKMTKIFSGIVTSKFKAGTGGRFASPSFPALSGVFLIIFVLYSNDLRSEAYHQHHQFLLYNNSINFLMSSDNFEYILTDYTLA